MLSHIKIYVFITILKQLMDLPCIYDMQRVKSGTNFIKPLTFTGKLIVRVKLCIIVTVTTTKTERGSLT